jgi:hypothetical protein
MALAVTYRCVPITEEETTTGGATVGQEITGLDELIVPGTGYKLMAEQAHGNYQQRDWALLFQEGQQLKVVFDKA